MPPRVRALFALIVPAVFAVTVAPAHAAYPNCTAAAISHVGGVHSPYAKIPSYYGSSDNDCQLGIWMNNHVNEGVRALQRAMWYCYRERGLANDGIFGPRTRDALIRTQRKAGTTADGGYGPRTKAAMSFPRFSDDGAFFDCLPGRRFSTG